MKPLTLTSAACTVMATAALAFVAFGFIMAAKQLFIPAIVELLK